LPTSAIAPCTCQSSIARGVGLDRTKLLLAEHISLNSDTGSPVHLKVYISQPASEEATGSRLQPTLHESALASENFPQIASWTMAHVQSCMPSILHLAFKTLEHSSRHRKALEQAHSASAAMSRKSFERVWMHTML
jgi:hypothetical protein